MVLNLMCGFWENTEPAIMCNRGVTNHTPTVDYWYQIYILYLCLTNVECIIITGLPVILI